MSYLGFEEGDHGQRDEEEHGHESSVEFHVVFGGDDPSICQPLPGYTELTYSNGAMRKASMRLNGAGLFVS